MRKKVLAGLLACCMIFSLAACKGSKEGAETKSPEVTKSTEPTKEVTDSDGTTEVKDNDPTNGEVVDGKFVKTRKITVEVYDRGNDGGSDPTNNKYTNYIKEGMLRDHNVEVEYVAVPRWTEVEQINNLLASGDAPDICVTYDYATIQTYANMGGILDLSEYVTKYESLLPNLWGWLGETNINWDKDPKNGTIWALEAKLAVTNRISTFVRRDWLEKLNLKAPTTCQEFENMLIAFRDNAELLLGEDANKMVPFSISYDVGWRAANLIESKIDPNISDKEYYVNGFDDRKLTQNGTKEAVAILNKWYNNNLIWKDFPLYGSGDGTEDDMMKAGYVGAFMHNWDYPYRNGEDSIHCNHLRNVGENAAYVAVDCFEDKNGTYTKFVSGPIDRKLFFPNTNDEPLASMMYLDWISKPENIQYLQIGDEGVTHEVLEGGAIAIKAATGDDIQNSGFNIDYTITCNGLKLVDNEVTSKSRYYSYAGVDPDLVKISDTICNTDVRVGKNVNVGAISAEEGMGPALSEKRDIIYDTAVVAPIDEFSSVWDNGIAGYLSAGGQAIIDERTQKWVEIFGDTDQYHNN